MIEDSLLPFDLPAVQRKKVTADFAGGLISSDGGLVLLREAERRLGLAERLAGCIREWRFRDDGNHAAGRVLAGAVHGGVPEAGRVRVALRFTGDSCVAVFERAFGRLRAIGIADHARHVEFVEALEDYDIVMTGPSAPSA